jgi:hypothetical protein
MHILFLVVGQWLSYLLGVTYLLFRWRAVSPYALLAPTGFADADDASTSSNTSEAPTVMINCLQMMVNVTGKERERAEGSWILLESVLFSALACILLLHAVRRHNRFERQSFVNSFVLLNKTVHEERKKRGESRDLLALFSNPAAPQQLQLRPLQLGQELKFLLRSIPPSALACEPAASIVDVENAIRRCDPSLLFFSGHSFAGSLAFELPNGRIELPPPDLFIQKLQLAERLQCCFLNVRGAYVVLCCFLSGPMYPVIAIPC